MGLTYNPDKDVSDLNGKVIFITGGTAGLGKQTILHLAKHNPAHIYFSGRNSASASAVVTEVQAAVPSAQITFVSCDLGSLDSVVEAVKNFNAQSTRLDILICNAGIMAVKPGLTKDGYEIQFGTNHLGHALLIKQLLPTLLRTAEDPGSDVRIVILSSEGHKAGTPRAGIQFSTLKTPQKSGIAGEWTRYAQSKLANILYARELARRYPSILTVAVHPGVINTSLIGTLGAFNRALVHVTTIGQMISLNEGSFNTLWASTARREDVGTGEYYVPVGVEGGSKKSRDAKLAGELWEWTERELGKYSCFVPRFEATHAKIGTKYKCTWPGCTFRGTHRSDHLKRHIKNIHEKEKRAAQSGRPPTASGSEDSDSGTQPDRLNTRDEIWLAKLEKASPKDKYVGKEMGLIQAVDSGKIVLVTYLLDHGADIRASTESGKTALHVAALNGNKDMLLSLLGTELDFNAQDVQGNTALHDAATKGYEEATRVLLMGQSDLAIKNKLGRTPLHIACRLF
ncbi:MAG: Ankyrin-3 [Icmadophila ericetorum]|nr:Ankyrin-3 [Icmadophila ericetorum]